MNCLEFRRQLGTNPRVWDERQHVHAAGCASCRSAAANSLQLELQIERALFVSVPAGLKARILEELDGLADTPKLASQEQGPGLRTRRGWLVAASLAALGATGILGYVSRVQAPADTRPSLNSAIVQIIRDEVLTLTSKAKIGSDELQLTLSPIGLSLKTPLENVRFATNCIIRGRTAAHWVLEGSRAPITVFVMPEEALGSRAEIKAGSMRGLVLPARRGSIAVVGTKGERLEDVGRLVHAAVNWNA